MIPLSHLQEWTAHAPWPDLRQVEQDFIISRALCDLFGSELLRGKIAFRGGTAINKLLFGKPLRYSEDIDLVQTQAEPIKETVAEIRRVLSWLGNFKYNAAAHSVHLVFKFTPEAGDGKPLKLKVEINTREHQSFLGLKTYPFEVSSDWHKANPGLCHSSRRNCLEPSCGRCYSGTRTAICSISMKGWSNWVSTLIA